MNINMKYWGVAALFASGAVFTACSDDETTESPETSGGAAYVVAGTVTGGNSTAAYLLTSGSLDEGEVTAVGNGLETDYSRAATWLFFGDKYLRCLLS